VCAWFSVVRHRLVGIGGIVSVLVPSFFCRRFVCLSLIFVSVVGVTCSVRCFVLFCRPVLLGRVLRCVHHIHPFHLPTLFLPIHSSIDLLHLHSLIHFHSLFSFSFLPLLHGSRTTCLKFYGSAGATFGWRLRAVSAARTHQQTYLRVSFLKPLGFCEFLMCYSSAKWRRLLSALRWLPTKDKETRFININILSSLRLDNYS